MKRIFFLCLALPLLAAPASAKDLAGRWGAGFTEGILSTEPAHTSLSVRYWMDHQLALEGRAGFLFSNRDRDGDDDRRSLSVGGRFLIKVIEEDNLHVYGGGGLALLNEKIGDDSDTGVGAEAFIGVEFFFQGLPHLGFTTEVGLALEQLGDRTDFRSDGGSFLNLGVRYYF